MKRIRKKNGYFQVYKVLVTDKNGNLRSAMYPMKRGYFHDLDEKQKDGLRRLSMSYRTEWFEFSKFGKIFAFRTLKAAKSFASRCRNSFDAEIWEALAVTAELTKIESLPDPWDGLISIKRWWKNIGKHFCDIDIPFDTLFCDGLRLVRKRNR